MKIISKNKNPKNLEVLEDNNPTGLKSEEKVDITLSKSTIENLEKFKAFLEDSSDAVFREFKLGSQGIPCALVYIDGLVNSEVINESVLKNIMYEITMLERARDQSIQVDNAYEFIKQHAVSVGEIAEAETLDKSMLMVMSGEVALIVEGSKRF